MLIERNLRPKGGWLCIFFNILPIMTNDWLDCFRDEKVKDFTFADISKYLDIVLELVPWKEMSQSDFVRKWMSE